MSVPLDITQLSNVDANAGNQTTFSQTVTLGDNGGNALGSPSNNLPGGSAPGIAPLSTPSTSNGMYVFIAALAYFAFKNLGGN